MVGESKLVYNISDCLTAHVFVAPADFAVIMMLLCSTITSVSTALSGAIMVN